MKVNVIPEIWDKILTIRVDNILGLVYLGQLWWGIRFSAFGMDRYGDEFCLHNEETAQQKNNHGLLGIIEGDF